MSKLLDSRNIITITGVEGHQMENGDFTDYEIKLVSTGKVVGHYWMEPRTGRYVFRPRHYITFSVSELGAIARCIP